jgi:hypothetical protein
LLPGHIESGLTIVIHQIIRGAGYMLRIDGHDLQRLLQSRRGAELD